jgi:uncharacterized membrane protein
MKTKQSTKTRYLCQAAMVAALYVVLTWVSATLGLDSKTPQCRLGEALGVLPLFMPAAVPGLTVGCFIANVLFSAVPADWIFGSLATLLGALVCRLIGRVWHSYSLLNLIVATLPNVVANTVIVPFVLQYAYGLQDGYIILMLGVGAGELISGTLLGVLLALAIPTSLKQKLGVIKL